MVVFGKSGCIRAEVVVFLQSGRSRVRWLYSGGKVLIFGQVWLYSGKAVVFGQKLLFSGKVIVFG